MKNKKKIIPAGQKVQKQSLTLFSTFQSYVKPHFEECSYFFLSKPTDWTCWIFGGAIHWRRRSEAEQFSYRHYNDERESISFVSLNSCDTDISNRLPIT